MALSNKTTVDINSLSTDAVFLHLLEIHYPSGASEYIVDNTESITWNGNTYISFPFEFDDISETTNAEVPQWTMRVSNVNRAFGRALHEYDLYLKNNGTDGNNITCVINLVSSNDLTNTEPITKYESVLSQPSVNATHATFKLTAKSPYNKNIPVRKIFKNFCSFKFKDVRCGYSGSGKFCDKTMTTCKSYSNSVRFGGFPGTSGTGVTLVN